MWTPPPPTTSPQISTQETTGMYIPAYARMVDIGGKYDEHNITVVIFIVNPNQF